MADLKNPKVQKILRSKAKHYGVPWGYRGDRRVILYMKIQHVAGQNL
jgi:hypothetical protein